MTVLPLLDVAVPLSCADQAERLTAGGSSEQTWHTGCHQQLGPPQSVPGTWHAKPAARPSYVSW